MNSQPAPDKGQASGHIPGLDGIRAIAVSLTMLHHFMQRYTIDITYPVLGNLTYAADGVGIFFVLSGFLITSLLLQEKSETGSFSFAEFYLRRGFRILPPLYAYMVFAVIFCLAVNAPINWSALSGTGLFYIDYAPSTGWWAYEHTWSLSVEEQFYLLWPAMLLLALRAGGKPAAARLAAFLILITPLLRIVTKFIHSPVFYHRQTFMLHTRMDALMCGCLVAILADNPVFERCYQRAARFWFLAPLYTFLLSGILNHRFGFIYTNSIGLTLDSACIAFFILWVSRNSSTMTSRILNMPVMVRLGILSYSLYLWQTFFIYYDQHAAIPALLRAVPVRIACIFAAALLSYILVERPSMALRRVIILHLRERRILNLNRTNHPAISR